jgi:voltage-gated potassium channel
LEQRKKRIFEIIEVGAPGDYVSRVYDFTGAVAIILNLLVSIIATFAELRMAYGTILGVVERITVAFFAVDYLLRVWTAKYLRPDQTVGRATWRYLVSFTGLVDLFSFLPYYMPFFFPAGTVAFRMVRIVRIFRLFRINAYYDSLNVITEVISGKKQQLISSVFIIVVLMLKVK